MIKKLIRVITIFALAFALLALLTNSMRRVQNQPCSICFDPDYAFAVTCFYKGEQVSGFNKIWYGGDYYFKCSAVSSYNSTLRAHQVLIPSNRKFDSGNTIIKYLDETKYPVN